MCWARAFGFAVPGQQNSRFGKPDGTSRKPVCFPYGTPSQEDQLLVNGINGVKASGTVSFFIQKSAGMPCIGAAESGRGYWQTSQRKGAAGNRVRKKWRPVCPKKRSGREVSGKGSKGNQACRQELHACFTRLVRFGRMRRDGECFPPASSLKLVRHAQLKSGDAVLVEAAAAQIAGHGFPFILGAGDHSVK
ncbi:hypothetical protein OFAG_02153 [Oxalobacter formigenes HOxBLS]|uniref:Uncharacterized protein n=1 Tax=Oxalobacter paraformigenes TaxID=556268 RepID=T5LUX9_9BURK|nr:hypothetical protein OFAG_02153 [Oxalobacter paraformigenes]